MQRNIIIWLIILAVIAATVWLVFITGPREKPADPNATPTPSQFNQ